MPAAEDLPEEVNAIGDSRKNDRDRNTFITGNSLRVQFPGGRFPAKFGCEPIKFELYQLTHAHPADYVRVHFRHLGYKRGAE